jgi:TP901 family phage tail tape measure protein
VAKGTLTVRIVGDAAGLKKVLGKAESGLKKFGKMAAGGAAAAGAAVVGFAAYGVKAFADFDQAMTNSTAIMGGLSDTMKKDMASAAREVAKTTKFSATEAAESFYFLASAGLDAAASIAALPKVAAFAQAGNFDMALATDLLTDAQSALGLSVDDTAKNMENMTRVSDVLVKANVLANASVEQFSEALTQKAGNALRTVNKDVEEGAAVLAVYADKGVKGSAAGVQLNAVLDKLTETARKNAKQYDKLGVAVFDSSGEMRNMADIVGDMETAFVGMTTEQKLAALSSLGLTRQARDGTLALLGSSDAIREYERQLRAAGGTTEEVAANQMDTFWAQLGLIKDNLLDVALSIGEALMPALRGFADWLKGKLPEITGWFDRVSTKFTDLLGVSSESMDGVQADLAAFNATASRTKDGVTRSLDGLATPLRNTTREVEMGMRRNSDAILLFRQDAETEFDLAGTLMSKMVAAWKVVWNTEIKPWFTNTLIPWFHNVVTPALIEWAKTTGAAMASALLKSLVDGLLKLNSLVSTPAPLANYLAWSDQPRARTSSGGSGGGGGSLRMHDGGIVPGAHGQEVPIIAMAGETVLPTHKKNVGGGLTIERLYVGSINDANAMNKELRKLAMAASYG